MEDYTARRLAESMEDLSARLNSNKMINELEQIDFNTRKLGKSIDDHAGKIEQYIESNEKLALEQQINRATEQFISLRIAYKNGVMDAKEVCEMLKFSYRTLVECYKRSSREVQSKYAKTINNVYAKYDDFIAPLEKNKNTEEDFKF